MQPTSLQVELTVGLPATFAVVFQHKNTNTVLTNISSGWMSSGWTCYYSHFNKCRWLERFVVLPLYFTWPLHILQTASDLFRKSPSLQKPKCFHTLDRNGGLIISRSSTSPLPSAMLCFVVFALLLARGDDVTDRQTEPSNV